MKKQLVISMIVVFMLGLVSAFSVSASATVSSYFVGCSDFSASGTTTSPYIVVKVYNYDTGSRIFSDAFPANGDGTFSVNVSYPGVSTGTELEYYVWGSPTNDPDDWDVEDYFESVESCQQRTDGPGVPTGFVLRTIWCDVAVYNAPAGSPVGSASIRAGQTWFVNATPVAGSDGADWTEIFAGGRTNGYIPTVCVS